MASKRQRKKQQTKKEKQFLKSVGVSEKDIKRVSSKERKALVKKETNKKRNRERSREIAAEAKRWGLSPSKFNSWKKLKPEIERIKREIEAEEKRAEKRRKKASRHNGNTLFVFWTDAQGHSLEEWDRQRDQVEHIYNVHGQDGLLSHIRETIHDRMGIPTGAVSEPEISDKKSNVELVEYYYSDGWREVYSGTCTYWLPLLKLIATMMTALYVPDQKLQFVMNLSTEVAYFNETYAKWITAIYETNSSLEEIKRIK